MLAPDPALAGLLPAAKGAPSRAKPGGTPVVDAAGAVGPSFDLLAEVVASPGVSETESGKPALPRGKAAVAARAAAGDLATPDPAGAMALATPALPLPGAPLATAALVGAPASPAGEAPVAPSMRAAEPVPMGAPEPTATLPAEPAVPMAAPAPPSTLPAEPVPMGSPALPVSTPAAEPARVVPAEVAAPRTSDEAPEVQRSAIRSAGMDAAVSFPSAEVSGDESSRVPAESGLPQAAPAPHVGVGWQPVAQPAAAAAIAAEPLAPVRPEAVAAQVVVAVARSGADSGKVELRLDPPELGRVEIHLAPGDRGSLHATVIAERAETHDLLRRHGEMLARELGAAGYSDVTLSFSGGSDAGRGGQPARLPELPETAFVLPAEDEPRSAGAAPRTPAVAPTGLDIRL